jgi:hypothetical protein
VKTNGLTSAYGKAQIGRSNCKSTSKYDQCGTDEWPVTLYRARLRDRAHKWVSALRVTIVAARKLHQLA